MFVPIGKSKHNWEDYSLLFPSICVGNVGQLTIDLIIYSLKAVKIGYFYHDSLLALVGNDPYSEYNEHAGKLMLSSEIYEDKINKYIIIQQRSPFSKGRRGTFRKFLISWIKQYKFSKIINLSATFSYIRNDQQLKSIPLRFLCSSQIEDKYYRYLTDNLKWIHLEESDNNDTQVSEQGIKTPDKQNIMREEIINDGFEDLSIDTNQQKLFTNLVKSIDLSNNKSDNDFVALTTIKYTIQGGGISQKLFQDCCKEDIPILILLKFCDEGDNTDDAIQLANYFNQLANLKFPSNDICYQNLTNKGHIWAIPPSWKLFFGNTNPPNFIY